MEKRDLSEHEMGEEPEMSKLMEKNLDREEEEEEKHWGEAKRMVDKYIESLYIAVVASATSKSQKTKSKKKPVSQKRNSLEDLSKEGPVEKSKKRQRKRE